MTITDEQRARAANARRRYARAAAQLDAARGELVECVSGLAAETGFGARPLARALGLPLHIVAGVLHTRTAHPPAARSAPSGATPRPARRRAPQ